MMLECLIGQRFWVRTPPSVAVRSSEREVGPIRTTLVHGTGERRPLQQLRPVLAQLGERRWDLMYPVSIEERRRRSAICHAEGFSRRPGAIRQALLQPGVRRVERSTSLGHGFLPARPFGLEGLQHVSNTGFCIADMT